MKIHRFVLSVIGLIFIISGFLKAVDSYAFNEVINQYGIRDLGYLAPLISPFEILLGLFLLFNVKPKVYSFVCLLVTVFFTIVFAYGYFARNILDCGCFGNSFKIPPYITFLKNIVIIVGCLYVWNDLRKRKIEITKVDTWKKRLIYILGALSFSLAGFTYGFRIIDNSPFFEGQKVSDSVLQPYDSLINNKETAVFLFNTNCIYCLNATENIKSFQREKIFKNVIGITSSTSDTAQFRKDMDINFKIFKSPKGYIKNEVKHIPVLLIIKNGIISKVYYNSRIPNARSYKLFEMK